MEFRNLTPFSVINYKMLDTDDDEYHVVAMKIVYQLQPTGSGHYQPVLEAPYGELTVQDTFSGEMNQSSVLQESDLAPLKFKCDVIVNGVAYAPGGKACEKMPVRLQVTTHDGQALLDKTLHVCGKREFQRTSQGEWQLTSPKKFTTLPIDYRDTFGGECKMYEVDDAAVSVPEDVRLTSIQQEQHPEKENPPIAHVTWEYNPLGTGFITPWYAKAKDLSCYPAPRIEHPDAPITAEHFTQWLNQPPSGTEKACQPAGLGIIGRAWLPRRTLAGTYDEQWLKDRHPYLPEDFSFRYWNNAPNDQQIDFPDPDIRISLFNLTRDGELHVQLPGHRPLVLLRMLNGEMIPERMYADTVILDSEALTLSMTYRYHIEATSPLRVMEARFEMDPNAPLIRIASPDETDKREIQIYG